MLSDRDRTLLRPHLALLRAAQQELVVAQQAFDDAERQAAESTMGTDWRDRTLAGLFSIDEGRARRYRQARGARKKGAEALAAARARYTKYAERMDGLLEPILTRDDQVYRTTLAAVRACDQALRAAEEMRFGIATALAKPARDARIAKADRANETWHEVEFARRQFGQLVAELRTSVPALSRTIDRAARALAEATGEPPPGRPALDASAVSDHSTMAAGQHLRGLQLQLDVAIKELARWQARAEQARVAALRAAQDNL